MTIKYSTLIILVQTRLKWAINSNKVHKCHDIFTSRTLQARLMRKLLLILLVKVIFHSSEDHKLFLTFSRNTLDKLNLWKLLLTDKQCKSGEICRYGMNNGFAGIRSHHFKEFMMHKPHCGSVIFLVGEPIFFYKKSEFRERLKTLSYVEDIKGNSTIIFLIKRTLRCTICVRLSFTIASF